MVAESMKMPRMTTTVLSSPRFAYMCLSLVTRKDDWIELEFRFAYYKVVTTTPQTDTLVPTNDTSVITTSIEAAQIP